MNDFQVGASGRFSPKIDRDMVDKSIQRNEVDEAHVKIIEDAESP